MSQGQPTSDLWVWSHVFVVYILINESVYMCVCMSVGHVCRSACGGQKMGSDYMKLELQKTISYLLWVLETELGSSADAEGTVHC